MFWRLIPGYGLLLLAALSVLGLTMGRRAGHFEMNRLREGLFARARLVRDYIADKPAEQREALLVKLVKEQPGQVRITLIDQNGRVLADSERDRDQLEDHARRPEIVAARESETGVGTDLRHSRSVDRDLLYVAIRAELPGSDITFVRIADGPEAVRAFEATLQHIVLVTLLVTGVLTVLLTVFMAQRISRPIEEVAQGAENIAAGQFGRKVHTSAGGEVARLARSFNFMSDRLAAQLRNLEEDQEQLRAILGGMVEGVIALDAEQRILFANDRAAHLLEFTDAATSATVGRPIWDVVRQRPLLDLLHSALNRPEAQKEELTLYGRANRSLTVYAVRLPGDPPRGAIVVLHDTSELRRLERLRQDFVANVSHELKTPLTVIKACVETLLEPDTLADVAQSRTFLEQVADQGERLHRLILDLLSLAKIESGAETFDFQTVGVTEVAQGCLERHRRRAEGRGLTLEKEGEANLTAWADEEALAEVLENLIDNAVKYTPTGGTIRVRWWGEGDSACVEVKDDGIGIPEPDLPRIFERFYRVDKARSRELGGTGLGLSIVKHLLQALNGTIAATSQVGRGTAFVVRLPRQASAR